MKENLLSSREVKDMLGVSMTKINSLEKTGELTPVRKLPLNKKRLYRAEDVQKYIDSITTKND